MMGRKAAAPQKKTEAHGRRIHLVCNAHLDPVWLWDREEGIAETISTFRSAADFCEEFYGFVFNHNESILYEWIEEHDPRLFERIRKLVEKGRWHIMGGWYLQPDCNMPCGESLVRQVLEGKRYFAQKFNATQHTAINFDSFGHSRGLVQLIRKAGQDSYIFCRPSPEDLTLPADTFIWKGFDGSEIMAHRARGAYFSDEGKAVDKVKGIVESVPPEDTILVLWGVGNHGGGPSRLDIRRLNEFIEKGGVEAKHSWPEEFFRDVEKSRNPLPVYSGGLNPWAVGCYTSQVRVKQKHRLLESEFFLTEKMLSQACLQGLIESYPHAEFKDALRDLLMAEFHDILPGSSVKSVEESSIRMMDHGLEILSRLKAKAFFALSGGQKPAKTGGVPVFVYNPHPFPVKGVFQCELQLAKQQKAGFYCPVEVFSGGRKIPSQVEKEESNLPVDWRKRVVFAAELAPSSMTRFDCRIKAPVREPGPAGKGKGGMLFFDNGEMEITINNRTGLIDRYRVNGRDFLREGAFRLMAMEDDEDPWGMRVKSFKKRAGAFRLMTADKGAEFFGNSRKAHSVRVVEEGEARSVVEAVFSFNESRACLRYNIPRTGTGIEVEAFVYWQERDKMLKLSIPTTISGGVYRGQTVFGVEELPQGHQEVVAQRWTGIVSEKDNAALTCINEGIYGSSMGRGEIRLSLLRSPAYAAHPIRNLKILPDDRFIPRIDIGERTFRLWVDAGPADRMMSGIDRAATVKNEKPFALSFFPSGEGKKSGPSITIGGAAVCMPAFYKSENGGYVVRLFEPSGKTSSAVLSFPRLGIKKRVRFKPFDVRTLKLDKNLKGLKEVELTEE